MRKLEKINLTDQIFDEIKKNIISGNWAVGTKIPSENDLAQMMGVSRISVRAALSRLQTLGYIETRGGEGSFVKEFSFTSMFHEVSDDIIMNKATIRDLREFRKNMEVDCTKLAIKRGSVEEIDELENILAQLIEAVKKDDLEAFLESDKAFHLQIARMSKNSLYMLMFEATSEAIKLYNKKMRQESLQKYPNDNNKSWNFVVRTHSEIVEAIKQRDFKACKKIYSEMFALGH